MKIPEYAAKYDPQNQFKTLKESYKQIEYAWNNQFDLGSIRKENIKNIIVTGLGGSAIAADLVQNFLKDELSYPFFVNRNYELPKFADENTLVIVSSYSGNTEETISVFEQAVKRKCIIVCISTGGEVEKIASQNNFPLIRLQPGFQPRYALGLSFFSLLKALQMLDIIEDQSNDVEEIINLWKKNGEELSEENNIAYEYAEKLTGFIPVIYSAADITNSIGYRWKCQFNENSKLHSFANVIPEMNHNEIIGWETYLEKQFYIKLINIIDEDYHPQVKRRFDIVSELLAEKKAEALNIKSDEKKFKTRLMDLIYLGDWISYYLALLRGHDPTEIKNINLLKEKLQKL